VTHFEKVTREEIARRNTEGTTPAYLRTLQDRSASSLSRPNALHLHRFASTSHI
jgi:hypothetical protein